MRGTRHRPRASTPHETCESARDHGSDVKGWTLWRWLPRRLGRKHAAKSEMTGCAAYAMTLSSHRSGAMAVRRCAQVRTAFHNSPILFADVFSTRRTACMNRRVARRRGVGQPRSGRPPPDVAGDVVEAVPVWRKPLHRRCPAQAAGPKILPRESAVPGVGHDAIFRHEVPAPGVGSAVQPATGGVLPLRLGRQHFPIQTAYAVASS